MSKAILNERESIQKNITDLLQKLTLAYQRMKEEKQEILSKFPVKEEEFSLLEEIELLTVNLRGYASRIQAHDLLSNESLSMDNFQFIGVFNIAIISNFYFDTDGKYEQTKSYIRMLDYLRLLIWEYLQTIVVKPESQT